MRITYGILTKELDNISVICFHIINKNKIVLHYDRKYSYIFYSVAMEIDVIFKRSLVVIECLGSKTLIFRLRLYFSLQTWIVWYPWKDNDEFSYFFAFKLNSKQYNFIKAINEQFQFNSTENYTGDNSD